MGPLADLAAAVRAGGGLLAAAVTEPGEDGTLGAAAAAGPRARGR